MVIDADTAAAERMVHDIGGRVTDQLVLNLIGEAMTDYEVALFAAGGRGQWAALDAATIAAKGHGRVLIDTGDLMQAATGAYTVMGDDVTVNLPEYAQYLRAGARGMPRRDPAPVPEGATLEEWADQVLSYMLEGRR